MGTNKDGDGMNLDLDVGQNQELATTNDTLELGVAPNVASTPTQKEKITILYPLEKEETKLVKDIVTDFEKLPPTGDQPDKGQTVTMDPMAILLNDLKDSLKASNDENARQIKAEIGGLRNKIDESNLDMSNKINGLKESVDNNAKEFRKEISRIDKRLDKNDAKTSKMIDKAIAEALRLNNQQRDERNIEKERKANQEVEEEKQERRELSNNLEEISKKLVEMENKTKEKEERVPHQERAVPAPTQASLIQMVPTIPTMTFARTTAGRRGEKEKNVNNKHPEAVEINDKPKFINTDHEKNWELDEGKKKIIIRVEREDFEAEVKEYKPEMSDDFILKNPVTYGARLAGIKNKIYNATGIMPWKLDITKISISTKKVKLAWVSFESAKTVNNIFRLMVQNGNTTGFHAFPHVPGKAMACKTAIENILKRLQSINKSLRYQIRLGKKDLEILVKEHKDFDWKPYRRIELEHIDPNNEVPDWDLVSRSYSQPTNAVNPFDAEKQAGKRGPIESPEGR